MSDVYICYDWQFSLTVTNRKGRMYKNHLQLHLADSYASAKWEMEHIIKKKGWTLHRINAVKVLGIAFAFYRKSESDRVPRSEYKNLPMPEIPEQL